MAIKVVTKTEPFSMNRHINEMLAATAKIIEMTSMASKLAGLGRFSTTTS
jgi:hypothetical protein